MSELFKSKLGWLLAGIHLLMVLTCLLYLTLINNQNVIVALLLMILTAPWGLLLMFLPGMLGIKIAEPGSPTGELLFIVEYAIGGLINAFILYLLGFLMTKAFNYFSSKKQNPS
jgi:hypothetical protein